MARETQLIFGFHAVTARLRHHPDSVLEIFVHAGRHDPRLRDLLATAQERGVRASPVDAQRLQGLAGHGKHQGVVARVEPVRLAATLEDVVDSCGDQALLLILDGVTDPHNLGACLRVADALGVHAVVAPKDRSAGLTPTVAKVASGALETIPFIPVTNLARTLDELRSGPAGGGRRRSGSGKPDGCGACRPARVGAGRRRRGHAAPDPRSFFFFHPPVGRLI